MGFSISKYKESKFEKHLAKEKKIFDRNRDKTKTIHGVEVELNTLKKDSNNWNEMETKKFLISFAKYIAKKDMSMFHVTVTFPSNFRLARKCNSNIDADNYLKAQNYSLNSLVRGVVDSNIARNSNFEYIWTKELQESGDLHTHISFYIEDEKTKIIKLIETIHKKRYLKSKNIPLGRILIQINSKLKKSIEEKYKLKLHNGNYKNKLREHYTIDSLNKGNFKNGDWVFLEFVKVENLDRELQNQIQYITKSLYVDNKIDNIKEEIYLHNIKHDVKEIFSEEIKLKINSIILKSLNIRRFGYSQALFPKKLHNIIRKNLMNVDKRHSSIYFTTIEQLKGNIKVEKKLLFEHPFYEILDKYGLVITTVSISEKGNLLRKANNST